MRNKFPEYYTPTEKEFEELWENCIFVFDTSVLLNLYEYSEKSRDEFLSMLKKISKRIWIPFQVGKEFQSRRPHIIREQKDKYHRIQSIITEGKNEIIAEIEKQKNIEYHPFIDKKELKKKIESSFSDIDLFLKECERKYPDLTKKDNIGEEIDTLFADKVGDAYTPDRMRELITIAKKRFEEKVPPGFADQEKNSEKRYWDFISWTQIIEYAKNIDKSVIFVNDDEKNDWWIIYEYKTPKQEIIAPHPELIKEFYEDSKKQFYMYNSDNFLKSFNKHLKGRVSNDTIKEVRSLRAQQQLNKDLYLWIKQNPELLSDLNKMFSQRNLTYHPIRIKEFMRALEKRNIPKEVIDKFLSYNDFQNIRNSKMHGYYFEPNKIRFESEDMGDIEKSDKLDDDDFT
jgi:hypothetical protein